MSLCIDCDFSCVEHCIAVFAIEFFFTDFGAGRGNRFNVRCFCLVRIGIDCDFSCIEHCIAVFAIEFFFTDCRAGRSNSLNVFCFCLVRVCIDCDHSCGCVCAGCIFCGFGTVTLLIHCTGCRTGRCKCNGGINEIVFTLCNFNNGFSVDCIAVFTVIRLGACFFAGCLLIDCVFGFPLVCICIDCDHSCGCVGAGCIFCGFCTVTLLIHNTRCRAGGCLFYGCINEIVFSLCDGFGFKFFVANGATDCLVAGLVAGSLFDYNKVCCRSAGCLGDISVFGLCTTGTLVSGVAVGGAGVVNGFNKDGEVMAEGTAGCCSANSTGCRSITGCNTVAVCYKI